MVLPWFLTDLLSEDVAWRIISWATYAYLFKYIYTTDRDALEISLSNYIVVFKMFEEISTFTKCYELIFSSEQMKGAVDRVVSIWVCATLVVIVNES